MAKKDTIKKNKSTKKSSFNILALPKNIISETEFDGATTHNIFEILPANIEGNHQFCSYWNTIAAIQRISRAECGA